MEANKKVGEKGKNADITFLDFGRKVVVLMTDFITDYENGSEEKALRSVRELFFYMYEFNKAFVNMLKARLN